MSKYTSIKPQISVGPDDSKSSFAALIQVKSSRFVERPYADPALESTVAIRWEMLSTKGNIFARDWTTGVKWEGGKNVSPDGKRLMAPIKPGSNANYLLQKIVAAEYPQDKMVDDISVFDGEAFFMAEDVNPKSKGSYKNLYPKRYHPEGWDTAREAAIARRAAKEAANNAPVYESSPATPISSYTPPAVVQSNDVLRTAAEALTAIVQGTNTGEITRLQLPAKLSTYYEQTKQNWTESFRKEVTVALWDMEQLKTVVSSVPILRIQDETISINKQ